MIVTLRIIDMFTDTVSAGFELDETEITIF